MPITVTEHAREESTFPLTVAFTYKSGTVSVGFTPNTVLWTLNDENGNLINNRTSVVATPGSSVNIVLEGDDLTITGTVRKIVKLLLEGTYNSTTFGDNKPYTEEATIVIDNLVGK